MAEDGFSLAATIFTPPSADTSNVIVIGPALGVPRYIYTKIARFFAHSGFHVLTFDYRGIYQSQDKNISGSDIQMSDWGCLDINAALSWVIKHWHPQKLVYLGHSCGGQLLGLAQKAPQIDQAVFIASQSGYWKLWPSPRCWFLWLLWSSFSWLTPLFEELPAQRLGLSSVNIPTGVVRQWARWGKSPNYLWDFISDQQLARYHSLAFPLLSIVFTDDRYFGPANAVKKLLSYYPATEHTLNIITPSEYGQERIGHFGFLKETLRSSLWQELLKWIEKPTSTVYDND